MPPRTDPKLRLNFYAVRMNHVVPNPSETGPTTVSQDLLAAALAALMPLGAGILITIGYVWIDTFGVILGAGATVAWGYWWRTKHGAFFPKDLNGATVGRIAVLVAVLAVVFILIL
jgi:hypothetical protein